MKLKMVKYDFNKVYVQEAKQDELVKHKCPDNSQFLRWS